MGSSILVPVILLILLAAPILPLVDGPSSEISEPPPSIELGPRTSVPSDIEFSEISSKFGPFTENAGQFGPDQGLYYLRGDDLSVSFDIGAVRFHLRASADGMPGRRWTYEVTFPGSNDVSPSGVDEMGYLSSFFIGNDPGNWRSGVRNFQEVWYEGLWNGVDLRYYRVDDRLKYEFILQPGIDPNVVRMAYGGIEGLSVDEGNEDLLVRTPVGVVRDERPYSYQEAGDFFSTVGSGYRLEEDTSVGFSLDEFDTSMMLVIDPGLEVSTFIGGFDLEWEVKVDLDAQGNVYGTAWTQSSDFPMTQDAYDPIFDGMWDSVIFKLDPTCSNLLYATYIGGSSGALAQDISVDDKGIVYLTGYTYSIDFPTTSGAFQETGIYTPNIFVVKFNVTASRLIYSTYIGGYGDDIAYDMYLDDRGSVYILGETTGYSFPTTPDAYCQTAADWREITVSKLSPDGSRLELSTYIGTDNYDKAGGIVADTNGNPIITGWTESPDLPTTVGAYDRTINGEDDAFVLKLDSKGSSILYCSYLGGTEDDRGTAITLGEDGTVFIAGETESHDFPTTEGAYRTEYDAQWDVFVTQLNLSTSQLVFSTYLGGNHTDWCTDICIDTLGSVYVMGYTYSDDFPQTFRVSNASKWGSEDVYIAMLSADGSTLPVSTILGESSRDWCDRGRLIAPGRIIVSGNTRSKNFPTTDGAFDRVYNYTGEGFISIVDFGIPPVWGEVPRLLPYENEPTSFNFSGFVNDTDTSLTELNVSSSSVHVLSTDGLNATFLFPEGMTEATVVMSVSDGYAIVNTSMEFTILPVNDAPDHEIPSNHTAVEDLPLTLDLEPYVWDVDNRTSDLFIKVDDPYISVQGLNITATFPDGILTYDVDINLSDGINDTVVDLHFDIVPVNDPPVFHGMDDFIAVEGRTSVLDVGPYLEDIDTPMDQLVLTTRERTCTVQGHELHFTFDRGDLTLIMEIMVFDGYYQVTQDLTVRVRDVNDPPSISVVPIAIAVEEETTPIDLTPFVSDEETPSEQLVITSQHASVVGIKGTIVSVRFDVWMPIQEVGFEVFDGKFVVNGSFQVFIRGVNDPPMITDIGGLTPPVEITLSEFEEMWLPVHVVDEDDARFQYSLLAGWSGVTMLPNGTLWVAPAHGDHGVFPMRVIVKDPSGAFAEAEVAIRVEDVNEPPALPILTLPYNHTIYEVRTDIEFVIRLFDPDLETGGSLTLELRTNITGVLHQETTSDVLVSYTDRLPVGTHRITVSVTDGEFTRTNWYVVTVLAEYVPPEPPEPPEPEPTDEPTQETETFPTTALAIIVVLIIVNVALAIWVYRGRWSS